MRKKTWYWSIWWWFGYRGLYQINWWYKGNSHILKFKKRFRQVINSKGTTK